MAREELVRLLSCLLKRGQSAWRCDDLTKFESRLFAELLHWKNSFRWFVFCFLAKDPRCTGQSGEELSLGLRCDKMSRPMRAGK